MAGQTNLVRAWNKGREWRRKGFPDDQLPPRLTLAEIERFTMGWRFQGWLERQKASGIHAQSFHGIKVGQCELPHLNDQRNITVSLHQKQRIIVDAIADAYQLSTDQVINAAIETLDLHALDLIDSNKVNITVSH